MIDKAFKAALAAPVILWGPPGVGKTAAVAAEARRRGMHLEVVVASIREPSDFLGLPVLANGQVGDGISGGPTVQLAAPAWAKRLMEANGGVLFFDEITTAPPAVQAGLLRVVLERVVGELQLPPETLILAAANPPEIAAGGWDLAPPLANRFIHLDWELQPTEWAGNFPGYWGAPPTLPGLDSQEWAKARSTVAAFIASRPELLLKLPADPEAAGKAWPSPRTWDFASRLLALGLESEIGGAVGPGAAAEFLQWLSTADLLDPEEVLANPHTIEIPDRDDIAFAAAQAVAQAVVGRPSAERWVAAWTWLARYPAVGKADVAAVAARDLARARQQDWEVPRALTEFLPVLREAGLLNY